MTLTVRLLAFSLVLFILHRKVYRRPHAFSVLDSYIGFSVSFVAALVVLSFVLVQIGLLDLVVILSMIILYFVLGLLDFSNKQNFFNRLYHIRVNFVYWIIKNFEVKKEKTTSKNKVNFSLKPYFTLEIISVLAILFFIFSFKLYTEDQNAFISSEAWYNGLSELLQVQEKYFGGATHLMMGESLIIKLYAMFTGLSSYLALYSFGVLQSATLTVIIFWFVKKITTNGSLAILAALAFATFYAFLPVNTFTLLEHKTMYTAFIYALPLLIFYAQPQLISRSWKVYLSVLFLLFLAIFLTDIYVGLFIVLPLLLLMFLFSPTRKEFRKWQIAVVLLIALVIFLTELCLYALYEGRDFKTLINSFFFSFQSFTYTPQLVLPYPKLKLLYLYATIGGLLLGLVLYKKNRERYYLMLSLLLYGVFILTLPFYAATMIDMDQLNEVYVIFVPVLIALTLFNILEFILVFIFRGKSLSAFSPIFLILAASGIYFHFNHEIYQHKENQNQIPMEVLEVYHQLHEEYLPYSYAVVNIDINFIMSEQSHYFVYYDNFLKQYLKKDSIYSNHKDDKKFLTKHPQFILPPSTIVFHYKGRGLDASSEEINPQAQQMVYENILKLKDRGREVKIISSTPDFDVYQIKNNSKSSKVHELIFP